MFAEHFTVEGRVSPQGTWMPLVVVTTEAQARSYLDDTSLGLHSYRIVRTRRSEVWSSEAPGGPEERSAAPPA